MEANVSSFVSPQNVTTHMLTAMQTERWRNIILCEKETWWSEKEMRVMRVMRLTWATGVLRKNSESERRQENNKAES